MRRAARKDGNQDDIAEAFRLCGCSVALTHQLGSGFPDLVAGRFGRNLLVEIKDGSRVPSERRLTDDEHKFHRQWKGAIVTVESVDDVVRVCREYLT